MIMMTMKMIISRLQDPLLVSPLHQPGCGHQGVPSVTQVRSHHTFNSQNSYDLACNTQLKHYCVPSQGNLKLPPGPLFLNPESALKSFKREVIDRQPEIFKVLLSFPLHCTASDEGPIGDLISESIFAHFQGLLTSVLLAATT